MSPQHMQHLVSILGHASRLAGSKLQSDRAQVELRALQLRLANEESVLKIRSEMLQNILHALVERRLDALQSSFSAVLGEFARQSIHYMEQQEKYSQAQLSEIDPLRSAQYHTRLTECDLQLARIRRDAKQLFQQMVSVLVALGGSSISPHAQGISELQLPPELAG